MSECVWNFARDEYWNTMNDMWFDVIPCIDEMQGMIMHGAPVEDAYAKSIKNDKKLHCKIVTIILTLKGKTYEQQKEICLDEYKVTASDIKLLLKEYNKIKPQLSVVVDNITIG